MKHKLKPKGSILALMVSVLIISNPAFACLEMRPLSTRLQDSEIAFEGHIIKIKKIEIKNPRRSPPLFQIVNVYKVDKGFKGIKKGKEVNIKPQYGLSDDAAENLHASPQVIISLNGRGSGEGVNTYYTTACPDFYPLTLWNRLILAFKYPMAIFQ